MEAKEGMYVRFTFISKINYIGKIVSINENREPQIKYAIYVNWSKDYLFIGDMDIIGKPSFNIRDLLKEGDYLNGLRIEKSRYNKLYISYTYLGGSIGTQEDTYTMFIKDIENDVILSIVTKEQFESMKYEVN